MNDAATVRGNRPLLVGTALICLLVPLIAALLGGADAGRYLQFPPHPPAPLASGFNWTAFVLIAAVEIAILAPFVWRIARTRYNPPREHSGRWPWWGSAGAILLTSAWLVAWTDWPALQGLRPHAFAPLWLGYIVVVNALLQARTGRSPLSTSPGGFLLLFPVSTLFWWLFEYLNQYVGNWQYVGTAVHGPWQYLTAASLPFSTVLPAVFSTWALLASYPVLSRGIDQVPPLPGDRGRWATAALLLGVVGLVGIGLAPSWAFPMLWLAPGLVLIGLQLLRGRPSLMDGPLGGDWRSLWLAAVAGLVCGFFWEMWNAGALARWDYSIPLVHGLEIFRMPLLGYGGYLPFGIICLACVHALCGARWTARWLPPPPSPSSDVPDDVNRLFSKR